jgi:hypothetical protein
VPRSRIGVAEAVAMSNPMQPPPYSLVQCLDRLSPRAHRKYDDLKALLADAEALQRSLMGLSLPISRSSSRPSSISSSI